jgi:hypothetical protein
VGVRRRIWQETELWRELCRREDEPAPRLRHLLEGVLTNEIEPVLKSGGAPEKFTLHDADHSWRVATQMANLAGAELLTELGSHDLAMLLLSAYLHDIGMTPPLAKIDAHTELLLDGRSSSLEAEEEEALQAWLDDEHDGLVPPIPSGEDSTSARVRRARELLADYVRYRHNDWSETWIRENEKLASSQPYSGWLDHLVCLCRSHHLSAEELKDQVFDPRWVGSPATVLHLRYCACLLRVADVLDFDPERTPPVLFRHRDIKDISAIFWRKDREIFFTQQGDSFILQAEPRDALIHHAVDQTIRDVDRELLGCHRLSTEKPFQHMKGSADLPHRWTLDTQVEAFVEPHKEAYKFIDGTFRPDPARLLELLGGLELYGSSLDAIRELLQNAFDAVREQMARIRLEQTDPTDPETVDRIARSHEVSLTLEPSDSGVKLVCRDSGVGMSPDAISSRFLVGGKTPGHRLRRLERACAEQGFSLGRTARFGIGVLSYFLLAERLVVRTRPSIESEQESGAWCFTSFGLSDFGELRQTELSKHGTEVELQIRPDELAEGAETFAEEVAEYVAETVRRAPCRFTFSAPEFGLPELSLDPGWPDRDETARGALLREFIRTAEHASASLDDVPRGNWPGEGDFFEEENEHWGALLRDSQERLELIVEEGRLPGDLGDFRIFLGHFSLAAGQSLAYLDLEAREGESRYRIASIGDGDGSMLRSTLRFSWNGMDILPDWEYEDPEEDIEALLHSDAKSLNSYIEIDLTSDDAGRLAVSRKYFTPDPAVMEALRQVDKRAGELLAELVDAHPGSSLALLNGHLIGRLPDGLDTPPSWIQFDPLDEPEELILAPLDGPAICDGAELQDIYRDGFIWRGEEVVPAVAFNVADRWEPKRNQRSWYEGLLAPQYVGATEDDAGLRPVLVWDRFEPYELPSGNELHYPPAIAQFPPEWAVISHLRSTGGRWFLTAWNPENPLYKALDSVAWEWAVDTFDEDSTDPLPHEEEILRARGRAAAWILMSLDAVGDELWNEVAASPSGFLAKAWELIGLAEDEEIVSVSAEYDNVVVRILTPAEWRVVSGPAGSAFMADLGTLGEEWLATRIPFEEEDGDDHDVLDEDDLDEDRGDEDDD